MRSQVFDDFDAFAESVRDVESKMLLRNPKQRVWSTASVDLGRIDLQFGNLGSGNIAQGALREDGYMLYLPLTSGVEYTTNGVVMPAKSFAILEPGCEFCISTKVEHDWCVAFVPISMLEANDTLESRASRSCRVTRPNPLAARQFQTTLLQVLNAAANGPRFESSHAATSAALEVLRIAQTVVAPNRDITPHQHGRPNIPRHKIIQSSMELLERRAGQPVSVQDLAYAADVSERTLRATFNEYFGIGPIRYLQLRRLHRVRRLLLSADQEEATVGQILMDEGEWAFGRFASHYRRLFGELPSETLRTKRP